MSIPLPHLAALRAATGFVATPPPQRGDVQPHLLQSPLLDQQEEQEDVDMEQQPLSDEETKKTQIRRKNKAQRQALLNPNFKDGK